MSNKDEPEPTLKNAKPVTRRHFFEAVGGTAIVASGVGTGALFGQYLEPNVLFEPKTTFKAGVPNDYPVGTVATNKEHRAYVIHDGEGFYAMSSICTHLGCITRWQEEEGIIACPCHGSKFTRAGDVITGPAPRPLPRLAIWLEKGELVVNTTKVVDRKQILKV